MGALQAADQALWLTPEQHVIGLHPPGSQGRVTLAVKQGERWLEVSHQVTDLEYAVRQMRDVENVYLSMNRFWSPRRRIAYLSQLDALFCDLDYYGMPDLAGRDPWQVLEMSMQALEAAHIPSPSVAVSSGRGLALMWLHDAVPRQALPRWNACQKAIFEALKHLGADARARDPARVLRLIGSRNSKNGAKVEALLPTQVPWDFDSLANEILPYTREELHQLRDLRIQKALRKPQEAHTPGPQGFSQATLWECRLSALQKLRQLRWFGPLPPGQRDLWLFVATTAMSWIAIPPVLRREAYALATDVGGWTEPEAQSNLQSVIRRAEMAFRGNKVEWSGRQVDARYKLSDQWIIDALQITEEEQRQLPTLWGADVRREKDREKKERQRRAAGAQTREEYLAQAALRRSEANRLREQGLSIRSIAGALGCSPGEVSRLLG